MSDRETRRKTLLTLLSEPNGGYVTERQAVLEMAEDLKAAESALAEAREEIERLKVRVFELRAAGSQDQTGERAEANRGTPWLSR